MSSEPLRLASTTIGGRTRAGRARRTRWDARASSSTTRASSSGRANAVVTREELEAAANARGLTLETRFFGPVFKIYARRARESADASTSTSTSSDDAEDADVVATHDGFIAPPPFGILHMDSMRVYNSKVKTEEKTTMRSTFGIAILLGTMSLLEASEAGCKKCELLAIDDGNEYAEKLVRYYGRLGFKTVRVVGDNGLMDLPDLLVWGGVGTRMNGDVDALLEKWGGVVRKQAAAAKRQ